MKALNFIWTPGHAGISGNEKADEGAQLMVVAVDIIIQGKIQRKKMIEQTWQQSESESP
jgi:ribonuclease HI